MSNIFDALQRSEAESSGVNVEALSEATDLLQRAERRAVSTWESVTQNENAPSAVDQIAASIQIEPRGTAAAVMDALPEFRSALADLRSSSAELRAAPVEFRPAPVQARVAIEEEESAPASLGLENPGAFQSISVPDLPSTRLVCHTDRQSGAAEAFRLLGVRLRHMRRDRTLKRVLVTSTIPQEGKSMVSANLACTLAVTTKQKTLLIEGDVRRPSLSKMFGLSKKSGLCDWLRGERSLTGCIYHLDGPDFCVMPAGSAPSNPLELLQSGRLATLLEQLGEWFEWIIIDTPPVLPLADTSVWARVADGILLVARQGWTEKRKLRRGLESIEHRKLIGVLLNSSSTASGDSDYYSSTEQ